MRRTGLIIGTVAVLASGACRENQETSKRGSGGAAAFGVLPAGTDLWVRLDQELSPTGNRPGDSFSATLVRPLGDGRGVLAPVGSTVRGTVTEIRTTGSVPALTVDFVALVVDGWRHRLETGPITVKLEEASDPIVLRPTLGGRVDAAHPTPPGRRSAARPVLAAGTPLQLRLREPLRLRRTLSGTDADRRSRP